MTERFESHSVDEEIEIQIAHHLPKGKLLLSSTAEFEASSKIKKNLGTFHHTSSIPKRSLKNFVFLNRDILSHFPHENSSLSCKKMSLSIVTNAPRVTSVYKLLRESNQSIKWLVTFFFIVLNAFLLLCNIFLRE